MTLHEVSKVSDSLVTVEITIFTLQVATYEQRRRAWLGWSLVCLQWGAPILILRRSLFDAAVNQTAFGFPPKPALQGSVAPSFALEVN